MFLELAIVLAVTIGFDYPDADLLSVTRFERQIDGGSWESIGIPASAISEETPSEHRTYIHPLPPITLGRHTVAYRACDEVMCSDVVTVSARVVITSHVIIE
jgi:hypothetical protein